MQDSIIEIDNLSKKYGKQLVVNQLNLNVKEGEIFGLLGPNGAGKSTTIRMILALTEPTSGSVKVCGYSSSLHPIQIKQKVGYLPEDLGFYNNMTGFENLMYTARLNRIAEEEAVRRINRLLELVDLSDESNKRTGAYSRGMIQRLGLADILLKKPSIIILDEPTLGLDPKGMKELLNQIAVLSKKDGITVLLSSHHLHQVQQICDRVGIFVKGRLIAEGDISGLSKELFSESPIVIEAGLQESPGDIGERDGKGTRLVEAIGEVPGVTAVRIKDNKCFIECKKDITSEIARTIVGHQVGLVSLHKKEYGLDDIYYKYFEGNA